MIDLNNPKDLKSLKVIKEYQEWKRYSDFVEKIIEKYTNIDNLETEVDLQAAKKLKQIKDVILLNNNSS